MAKSNTIPAELKEKLNEINSWLFYGDKQEVAKRSGMTPTYVGMVLKGDAFNKTVIEKAIEVMNENKVRFEIKPKMEVA